MAQPKPDTIHLSTEAPPSARHEPPAPDRQTRKTILDDRLRTLEQLARRSLDIGSNTSVQVEYLAQYYPGDAIPTKRSFKVSVLDKRYLFTVKRNAGDGHDIRSQIATMDCIRQNTDVFQVPKVIAYDVSDDNEMGRAWIAREYIQGANLCDSWSGLSMDQKAAIVQNLARYLAQLHLIRFDKIGSLVYDNSDDLLSPVRPTIASWSSWFDLWCYLWIWFLRLSSAVVTWITPPTQPQRTPSHSPSNKIVVGKDPFITYPGLPTGPFQNVRDWFLARLQQTIRNNLTPAETDGNYIDRHSRVISESIRWTEYIRQRPSLGTAGRTTTLYHPVKESSILVSDDGQLIGLLNYDNVRVCPVWTVTVMPDALMSHDNEMATTVEEFIESRSSQFSPADRAIISEALAKSTAHRAITKSELDDPSQWPHYSHRIVAYITAYWKQLETYEKTRLRDLLLSTMSGLAPEWVTVYSKRKMDATIGIRVRDLVNGSVRYLDDFKEEFEDGPHWTDDLSERSWPSDDDTAYEGLRR